MPKNALLNNRQTQALKERNKDMVFTQQEMNAYLQKKKKKMRGEKK